MSAAGSLERSDRELAAARLLADGAFGEQACSRACLAALHAAGAALAAGGERPARPAAVVAAFDRQIVLGGGFAPDRARPLRLLLELRAAADGDGLPLTGAEASEVLADAEAFVRAVEAWLGGGAIA